MLRFTDPRETGPWAFVVCGDCGRQYQCTPTDDHYLRADDPDGSPRVCFGCLLKAPTERDARIASVEQFGSDVGSRVPVVEDPQP